jgi:hypothetical protein
LFKVCARGTVAASGLEDRLPQLFKKNIETARIAGRQNFRKQVGIHEFKTAGLTLLRRKAGPGFVPGKLQPVINRGTRASQDLDDFFRVIAVKEPEYQNARDLCRLFARAGVLTDATQLILRLNLVAQIDCAQADFGRVLFDNRKLL